MHDGSAWVGLVPFRMVGVRVSAWPSFPYLGTFAETNVRTYVNGPRGRGVWFNSLDAARMLPVAVARIGYRLPYFFSSMRIERTGEAVRYNSIRRWPGPRGAGGSLTVRVGERIEPTETDIFLTARWRLYTQKKGHLYVAEVRHPSWPLQRAVATKWDRELVSVAGYEPEEMEPHVLFSDGVPVEVYPPERIV